MLDKRQSGMWDDDRHWYYSSAAVAVKWSILVAIFLIFVAYFVGGYLHARRRMRNGLPPLPYHRWLVPRRQRARFDPQLARPHDQFSFYHAQDNGHYMHAMPPPAYNPNMAPPPTYQPPVGASKVDPSQHLQGATHPTAPAPRIDLNRELPTPGAQGPSVPVESRSPANLNPFR